MAHWRRRAARVTWRDSCVAGHGASRPSIPHHSGAVDRETSGCDGERNGQAIHSKRDQAFYTWSPSPHGSDDPVAYFTATLAGPEIQLYFALLSTSTCTTT